jgi:LuxR family transcriptional regulator, activator of conjugal transfer of Ti plasmids
MTPAWQTFIDRIHAATDVDALRDAMTEVGGAFGAIGFTYISGLKFDPSPPPYITTYPGEWVRRYLNQRYYEIDPVFIRARESLLPFIWDHGVVGAPTSNEQRRLFAEAEEFGINGGFTVPIPDGAGDVATLSFATEQDGEPLQRTLGEHRQFLHLAAMYFHIRARHQLGTTADVDRYLLSSEETACLERTAHGENARNIGEVLGLSPRSVAWHLRSAKRKLNAATLPQAVAVALKNRLIKP